MGYSAGSSSFGIKAILIAQLLQVLFPVTFAVDADCDNDYQMAQGESYKVYNSEYPIDYSAQKKCRWIVTAPKQYIIQVNCKIEILENLYCSQDQFLISFIGDPNFENSTDYSGFDNLHLETQSNKISIGLFTEYCTSGGRFFCTITSNPVKNICNCGWKNTQRIVGGTETQIHEFPMMAAIVDSKSNDTICGATIIDKKYAITAAQCVHNRTADQIVLLVGAHKISSPNNATKFLQITNIIIHLHYLPNDPKGNNDIAIIQTYEYIIYNMDVAPVCLPLQYLTRSFEGEIVDVLGWGKTEYASNTSDVLLEADMKVLSEKECSRTVEASKDQICTFKKDVNPCQGDSGGPLIWTDPTNHMQLVGVISQVEGCASSKPSVNTRVTSYLSWIQSVTPDAEYCVI